ncbi:MAG TPA: HD domain-containing phosphohydrolase [Pyrinomonadaceae bacterium]|jgi:HD-GYP domain-containing protein (c-di-GMP phosphodiesterase class II)|nr:HD domain-containing phosphohydrolase [Pyrinomonadaceae bacterium]
METNNQRLLHTFAALADLGQEIANTSDFEEMLRSSFHLLLGSVAIRRGAIAQHDRQRDTLRIISARGLEQTRGIEIKIARDRARELTILGATLTLASATAEASRFMDENPQLFAAAEIQLLLPLVVHDRLIGVVLLGEKASGEKFTEEDLDTLSALARHIAVGINSHHLLAEVKRKAEENQHLYDGLRTIYKETVRAFAAAIDIKDRYTQGHSVRVGKYSEVIAREMGWTEEEVEGITIAGYLHDIGKLIVDLSVINSPERFSAKDSAEMSKHPAAGYEILSPISHPYADIPLMARYHHERMDGGGYPDGLKGDQIPPGARIVTLADSFDAMTTDRPYRKKLPLEDVLIDFKANTGTQFDPVVVCAFCRAFLKEIEGRKERRLLNLLHRNYDNLENITPLLNELLSDFDVSLTAAAN